jgi:PAS domain S-box-containing protein
MIGKNRILRTTLFILAIILVLLSGIISFYYNAERNITSQLVDHTNKVLREATETFSIIKDFESGSRGYVITGDSNYLKPYAVAKNSISFHIKKLKELTADNPSQQKRIDSLSALIDKRIAFAQQSIQLRDQKGFEAARQLIATRLGNSYMNTIKNVIAARENEENNLLIQRQEKNDKNIAAFRYAFFVFLSGAFVLLVIYFFTLRQYLFEIRKAENALRDSEHQLQTLFNSAPDAIIVVNDKNKIVKWNTKAESLFGWKEHEALGKSLNDTIIPQRYHEAHQKGFRRFLETHESSIMGETIELSAVNKNKNEFNIALSIAPTLINNQYFFIGFIRDITEQKKAEGKRIAVLNELKSANKELETFNYSVSHDLKSPLRAITSFSEIFLSKYSDKIEEDAIHMVNNINSKAAKMNRLIDDLLDFSRLGRKEPGFQYIEMDQLVIPLIEE